MEVKNVKVIGCGGIGLHLLDPLCRYVNFNVDIDGIDIHLIDGDEFEHRNQERQKFAEIGNKAEITANRLRDEFRNIMFWEHADYITEDNVLFHLREEDCILLCVDNHATRKLIVERCQELDDVTLISGGNDYTDGNVMAYLRRDGEDLTKPPTVVYPEIAEPEDENPGDVDEDREGGCAEEAANNPQLIVANNMAAALMLNAFYGLLHGDVGSGAYGDILFDVKSNSTRQNERAKV
tara:strand:+ start:208 stop:918 length:711 start_codon:yes stop_codon:yes gene_type:complete